MKEDQIEELGDNAFQLLEKDDRFKATAGAVYEYGYQLGRKDGQKAGVAYGRSMTSHWAWAPVVMIAIIAGMVFGIIFDVAADMTMVQPSK